MTTSKTNSAHIFRAGDREARFFALPAGGVEVYGFIDEGEEMIAILSSTEARALWTWLIAEGWTWVRSCLGARALSDAPAYVQPTAKVKLGDVVAGEYCGVPFCGVASQWDWTGEVLTVAFPEDFDRPRPFGREERESVMVHPSQVTIVAVPIVRPAAEAMIGSTGFWGYRLMAA